MRISDDELSSMIDKILSSMKQYCIEQEDTSMINCLSDCLNELMNEVNEVLK